MGTVREVNEMSRYIDADAVIDEMSEKHRPNFHEDLKSYHMWIMWYWALKNAPSIDIVRCKECKWCYKDTDALTSQTVLICQRYNDEDRWARVNFDDFCSYGEREGE